MDRDSVSRQMLIVSGVLFATLLVGLVLYFLFADRTAPLLGSTLDLSTARLP
ncbi:MAG: hypothetical protein GWN99_09260 [Gemmatimonadetes bacterium]|nr:hypothetical protein [Gemmatimonadota bacterium]NIS01238.1 hypothetical protein [Gemmatimonadota bacterium]NIU51502.1 hypothetical protein [Gemmatimonadota bacterium]NIW35095.1 hypothetical protein [Gemmatimonadota bacterium]NIY43641.1 hypothetical protein [Gemmatimonadota bacterium]